LQCISANYEQILTKFQANQLYTSSQILVECVEFLFPDRNSQIILKSCKKIFANVKQMI